MKSYDWHDIKHHASGQWVQILGSLAGIGPEMLRNRHSPCPACGGKDRFRFDDKNGEGTYFCSQCSAGDGISLLEKCSNMPFFECVQAVGKYLMLEPSDRSKVYTPPPKVNKIVSTRKNDFVANDAAIKKWVSKTESKNISSFSMRFRIKTALLISEKNCPLWVIERAKKDVNCYVSAPNNSVSDYLAHGMTNGGYHRINENEGRSIFFCVNIIDSHLTAQFTNSECVCVFEYANLLDAIEQYKEDYKPEKPIFISINNSETELILAESTGYKAIMPIDSDDIQTSSGFHKKTFDPAEILDK
jgi:hypothetical protein